MQAKTTPKDFFLWAGAMVTLYWSVTSFLMLIFNYINYSFPDPLNYYASDPYQSGVAYEMSSLMVLFPLFIFLMWLIHRDIRNDASRSDLWVRRWALVLTLFIAGITMAVDLIVLLNSFLSGEAITVAFMLKVVVVFGVAAVVFMHFIADLWGYWEKYPRRGQSVGAAAFVLVLASIVAGFFILGTPYQARQLRFDEQKINDLMQIQSQVVSYYQAKQKLPTSLGDLKNSLSYYGIPKDPQSGTDYAYRITTPPYHFEVCATFNAAGRGSAYRGIPASESTHSGGNFDNWEHAAGQHCFERTIDPELYPQTTIPLKPTY